MHSMVRSMVRNVQQCKNSAQECASWLQTKNMQLEELWQGMCGMVKTVVRNVQRCFNLCSAM